jgi:hypothetical protein
MDKVRTILAVILLVNSFFSAYADSLDLTLDHAKRLADLPLHCIEIEYPNKLNQVLTDSTYIDSPKNLHPVFYGCFDWHSSVHGYWLLAEVMHKFPGTDVSTEIVSLFDRQFTEEKVAVEFAYFYPKLEKSFERTYGWAWLLKLYASLSLSPLNATHQWTDHLAPLKNYIVEAYKVFLPKLLYPIRVGEHNNTAFGLSLALDYAYAVEDYEFVALIQQRSKDYFMKDCDCPLGWEPGGFDFISPCLQEAELMQKVLDRAAFKKWMKQFLPGFFKKGFSLVPGEVADRTDGKLVHLDGLNFSRARTFYALIRSFPEKRDQLLALGDEHLAKSMPYVVGSDYMGSHWLATFLVYALEEREKNRTN